MNRYLTKVRVEEYFRTILDSVRKEYERDGIPDYPARTEAWHNYTDQLCKDGAISQRQYDGWTIPECCWSPSEKRERAERREQRASGTGPALVQCPRSEANAFGWGLFCVRFEPTTGAVGWSKKAKLRHLPPVSSSP